MPIHDLGYREWQGSKSPRVWRWWVIATGGVSVAWRNLWLRRMMLVSWLPATYVGLGFFAFEYYVEQTRLSPFPLALANGADEFRWGGGGFREDDPERRRDFERRIRRRGRRVGIDQGMAFIFTRMVAFVSDGEHVQAELSSSENPQDARHAVWAWFLMLFFRYPQGLLMLLVVGMIAPPLIARDVRSKGFLLYFSRPLTPLEYLFAKAMIVWFFLALMTTLPALLLYLIGVLLSPSLAVALDTWDLPLRIVGASIVLMVPTTALALLFSSVTAESRFAGFAWFTVWALGWIAYFAVRIVRIDEDLDPRWTAVSLYHTLGSVQRWIFGVEPALRNVWYSVAILVGLTVFSVAVLLRRVSAPIRI